MLTITLYLSDGRTITTKLDEPVDTFVLRWKKMLATDGIVILSPRERPQYVAARHIVSVR